MSLAEKYPKEVKKILAKYPPEHKRSAVMPLLYLAQREEGHAAFARDDGAVGRLAVGVMDAHPADLVPPHGPRAAGNHLVLILVVVVG